MTVTSPCTFDGLQDSLPMLFGTLSDCNFKVCCVMLQSPAKSGAATPASLPPRGSGISPAPSSSSSPGLLPLPPPGYISPLLQPPRSGQSGRGSSVPPKAQANLFGSARGGGRPLAMGAAAPPPMIPEDLFAQPGSLPAAPPPTPSPPAPSTTPPGTCCVLANAIRGICLPNLVYSGPKRVCQL